MLQQTVAAMVATTVALIVYLLPVK